MVEAGVLEAHNQDKQNATFSLGLSPWQRGCVHFRTNPDRNLTGEHRVYFCSRTVSYSGENQKSWENPSLRGSLLSTLQILAHLALFVFQMNDSEVFLLLFFSVLFFFFNIPSKENSHAGSSGGRRGRKCESTFHSILISEFHIET